MPWQEIDIMSLREDFISLATLPQSNISELSRRFDISRKTAYKWLQRYRTKGYPGLIDQSRRPHRSPNQISDADLEAAIISWRQLTGWGGRKIKKVLENEGRSSVPSIGAISAIIKRNGLMSPSERKTAKMIRFNAKAPNRLWQMDFKGPIKLRDGYCEPLTVLDDYSRFSLAISPCENKTYDIVKDRLTGLFRIYGMPWSILADNGCPWGKYFNGRKCPVKLEAWLMTLGIKLIHSRPFHPQTCGKEERFHRTLKQELVGKEMNCCYHQCQDIFDRWRHRYNTIRPHEALDMETPASRYRISDRKFPENLPEPEYDKTDVVRKVRDKGRVRYDKKDFRIGEAFVGHFVAIRSTSRKHIKAVYFYREKVAELDLRKPNPNRKVLPMSMNKV